METSIRVGSDSDSCLFHVYEHVLFDLGQFETQSYSSGKYVWACGKTYEGQFLNGKPDGQGTMEYQVLFFHAFSNLKTFKLRIGGM